MKIHQFLKKETHRFDMIDNIWSQPYLVEVEIEVELKFS